MQYLSDLKQVLDQQNTGELAEVQIGNAKLPRDLASDQVLLNGREELALGTQKSAAPTVVVGQVELDDYCSQR